MLDLTKPVTTRDGRPARVLCTDRKSTLGTYPVLALVETENGSEMAISFTPEGRQFQSHETYEDLINPKKKLFMLIWDNCGKYTSGCYQSDYERTKGIAACIYHHWKVYKTFEIEVD